MFFPRSYEKEMQTGHFNSINGAVQVQRLKTPVLPNYVDYTFRYDHWSSNTCFTFRRVVLIFMEYLIRSGTIFVLSAESKTL